MLALEKIARYRLPSAFHLLAYFLVFFLDLFPQGKDGKKRARSAYNFFNAEFRERYKVNECLGLFLGRLYLAQNHFRLARTRFGLPSLQQLTQLILLPPCPRFARPRGERR